MFDRITMYTMVIIVIIKLVQKLYNYSKNKIWMVTVKRFVIVFISHKVKQN